MKAVDARGAVIPATVEKHGRRMDQSEALLRNKVLTTWEGKRCILLQCCLRREMLMRLTLRDVSERMAAERHTLPFSNGRWFWRVALIIPVLRMRCRNCYSTSTEYRHEHISSIFSSCP
jgi:hypothetical protein